MALGSGPDPLRALVDAEPAPFWLDDPGRPEPRPALGGRERCDLLVVGAGYCGLWTALSAKERDPDRDVVVVEARTAGWAASGRNGGFCEAGLTHGLGNGQRRWPAELARLHRLGLANLAEFADALRRHDIDCEWERPGGLTVATRPHQVAGLRAEAAIAASFGADVDLLDADEVRAQVNSPTYLAAARDRHGVALVHPAKLVWGLRAACVRLGVRIYEGTRATSVRARGAGVVVTTGHGEVVARRAALATNAFPSLVRRARPYVIPVYDYAMVTEPLTPAQLDAVGWRHRYGMTDAANQFHYYRLTSDDRILWGGYDAIYHYGSAIRADLDQRPATFRTLAANFLRTFPQLDGVRFTHTWGGVIDASTRFTAFYGTAARGRVAYTAGFTGLGVAATRFAAQVLLDLLDGDRTERTELEMVRTRPVPFPPEPVRWLGVQLTRRAMANADRDGGAGGLWLRALNRIGVGFDS